MQEIRFTHLEGRQGVFIPTNGGYPQITMDESTAKFSIPGAPGFRDYVFISPQRDEADRQVKEAREKAEDYEAQRVTSKRLTALEAEVKELRCLWSDAESKVLDLRTLIGNLAETLPSSTKQEAMDIIISRQTEEIENLRGMLGKMSIDLAHKKLFDAVAEARETVRPIPKAGFAEGTFLSDAVARLRQALADDPALFQSYQANIAMAFFDTYMDQPFSVNTDETWLRNIGNGAAKRFLDNLIYPLKKTETKA